MAGEVGELIKVQLLGRVRAWRGAQELALGRQQQQLVLAVLAMRPGLVAWREALVDALWEQACDGAVNTVHKCVHGLRAVLEPGRGRVVRPQLLVSVTGGYELRLQSGQVDVTVFARHRETARRLLAGGQLTGAGSQLAAGLGLWRDRR